MRLGASNHEGYVVKASSHEIGELAASNHDMGELAASNHEGVQQFLGSCLGQVRQGWA